MHIFANPPEAATRRLLSECNLPTEDLSDHHFEHFFGCGKSEAPSGVVGLELYGSAALLRSLAVCQAVRGRGCAKRLVAEAEAHARDLGVRNIYLLTNTAKPLFESLGYTEAARELAPAAIRATREFSSLCPESASFMVKNLEA